MLSESPLSQLKVIASGPLTAGTVEETGHHLTTSSFQEVVESDEVPQCITFVYISFYL